MEFTTIMERKGYRKPKGKACRQRSVDKFTAKMNAINLPQLSHSRVVLDNKYLLSESEEKIMGLKSYLHSNYSHYEYRQIRELVSLAELDPETPVLKKYWDEIEENRLKALSAINLVNSGEFLKSQTTDYFSSTVPVCVLDTPPTAAVVSDGVAVTDSSEVCSASVASSFSQENEGCNSSVIKKIINAPAVLDGGAGLYRSCSNAYGIGGDDKVADYGHVLESNSSISGYPSIDTLSVESAEVVGGIGGLSDLTCCSSGLTTIVIAALLLLKKVLSTKRVCFFSLRANDDITLCGVTLSEKLAIRLGSVDYLLSRSNMQPLGFDGNIAIETYHLSTGCLFRHVAPVQSRISCIKI